MKGSWSIEKVLPAVAPDLNYADLDVQDGLQAQKIYLDFLKDPKHQLDSNALKKYCKRDTEAMVHLVHHFCYQTENV